MNTQYEDYDNSAIRNVKVEEERKAFRLSQLKLEHFYFNSGEIDIDMPISTSIELKSNYDFEKQKPFWTKVVTHNYHALDGSGKLETSTWEDRIVNSEELIQKLEENDLRNLCNNYFTEDVPERFSRFEITYNYHFKIVGTYDKVIPQLKNLTDLLELQVTCDIENNKIQKNLAKLDEVGE